ncbi:MAG: hypothetical protein WAT39_21200 [Planctomycetota bacterium]
MRFLPTLLLLLVLPGLLLPAGFVLSLCPCAERAEPTAESCCGPSSCGCCVATTQANDNPDDDAVGQTAGAHQDCLCPVLRGPDRKTAAVAPDRGGDPGRCEDPGPDPIVLPPEWPHCEPLTPGATQYGEAAERSPPPPDRARNLPLLL